MRTLINFLQIFLKSLDHTVIFFFSIELRFQVKNEFDFMFFVNVFAINARYKGSWVGIMLDRLSSTIMLITQWRLRDSVTMCVLLLPTLLGGVHDLTLLDREGNSVIIDINLSQWSLCILYTNLDLCHLLIWTILDVFYDNPIPVILWELNLTWWSHSILEWLDYHYLNYYLW